MPFLNGILNVFLNVLGYQSDKNNNKGNNIKLCIILNNLLVFFINNIYLSIFLFN